MSSIRATIVAVVPRADLRVRLTPRAARPGLSAAADGSLVARVAEPPVDGRANEALCRLIAKAVGVAPSRVAVLRGAKARTKVVRVEGIDDDELRARIGYRAATPRRRRAR